MDDEKPREFRLPEIKADLPPERLEAIRDRIATTAVAFSVNSTIGRRAHRLPSIGASKRRNPHQHIPNQER